MSKRLRSKYRPFQLGADQVNALSSDLDASTISLVAYCASIGLRLWEDTNDAQRIMFDATQFNQLNGFTATKGIKGDFLKRLVRRLDEMDLDEGEEDLQDGDGEQDDEDLDAINSSTSEPAQSRGSHAERDSDFFEDIIASGHRGADMYDARVGSTRLLELSPEIARQLLPTKSSSFYLIHILVLAAWIKSKAYGASVLLQPLFATTSAGAASTSSTPASPLREQLQLAVNGAKARIEHSLQLKSENTLHHILAVAGLMRQSERQSITTAMDVCLGVDDEEDGGASSTRCDWDAAPRVQTQDETTLTESRGSETTQPTAVAQKPRRRIVSTRVD